MVGTSVGVWQPMGYLYDRFGTFMNAGFDVWWMLKSKWLPGADFKYGYTSRVKEDVLKNLKNEDGFITNNEGNPADLRITGRIWYIIPSLHYKFSVLSVNINSGLLTGAGVGYVEHRIKFLDYAQMVASLNGNLYKGYDRRSGGIILKETVGYLFIGENRVTNIYIGVCFFQMFTRNYRRFNYDEGKTDNQVRMNLAASAQLIWILPLYKKTAEGKYYTE